MSSADVLILTALQDELEAVLTLGDGGRGGWEERRDLGGFRYYQRAIPSERGCDLDVAAAWSGEMGEPGELDPYLPDLRLPDDASFLTLPPPKPRGP
jgi:hypothetical protein